MAERLKIICAIMILICTLLLGCGSDGPYDPYNPNGKGTDCSGCKGYEACTNGKCEFKISSQWDLVLKDGTVSEKDPNGSSWDFPGGLPDPYVCVTSNSIKKCSTYNQDTTKPSWYETIHSGIGAGSLMSGVYIEYVDKDSASDDAICTGNITVSKNHFYNGGFSITCSSGNADFSLQFKY